MNSPANPLKDAKSLEQVQSRVSAAIRHRIRTGDLVPGQRLIEAELAEILAVAPRMVRVALDELIHEGLVERIRNRGARVRVVSLEEALHIVEVRFAIESICIARAATKISDDQISELRGYAQQLQECVRLSDLEGFVETRSQIMQVYLDIAQLPVAVEALARLRAQNTRHRLRLSYRPGRTRETLPFWLDIIDAICARDPANATAALSRHVRNIEETLRSLEPAATPFGATNPHDD